MKLKKNGLFGRVCISTLGSSDMDEWHTPQLFWLLEIRFQIDLQRRLEFMLKMP